MKKVIIPQGLFVVVQFSGLNKSIEHRFLAEEDSTDEVKRTLLMNLHYNDTGSIVEMASAKGKPGAMENVSIKEDVVFVDGKVSNGISIYEGVEYPFSIKEV